MIIRKLYRQRTDGVKLYCIYSDAGYYIIQNETGEEYAEVIDVENASYSYSETDKLIENKEVESHVIS